jgi:hypothetical protein
LAPPRTAPARIPISCGEAEALEQDPTFSTEPSDRRNRPAVMTWGAVLNVGHAIEQRNEDVHNRRNQQFPAGVRGGFERVEP